MTNPLRIMCVNSRISVRMSIPRRESYMDPPSGSLPVRSGVVIPAQLGKNTRDLLVNNGVLNVSTGPRRIDVCGLSVFANGKTPGEMGGLSLRRGEGTFEDIMRAICGRLLPTEHFYVIPLQPDSEIMDILTDFSAGNRGKGLYPLYCSLALIMAQLYVRYSENPPKKSYIATNRVSFVLRREGQDRPDIMPLIPLSRQIATLFNKCFIAKDGRSLVPMERATEIVKMVSFLFANRSDW